MLLVYISKHEVHTKRFVAATCRLTLLLQLVARPVHKECRLVCTDLYTSFDSGLSLFHKLKFNNHLIRCICILPKHLLLRKGEDLEAKSSCKVTSKSAVTKKDNWSGKTGSPQTSFCQLAFLFVVFIQRYVSQNLSKQCSNLSEHFIWSTSW